MGIKDTVKDFGILKNRKADVEFSGLTDMLIRSSTYIPEKDSFMFF